MSTKTHKSGEVAYNGQSLNSFCARIAATAAAVPFGWFVAPCDGTMKIGVHVVTALTHATSDLEFGKSTDDDSVLLSKDIQNLGIGYHDLSSAAEVVSLACTKGEVYFWTLTGGDSTGEIVVEALCVPS